jgi:NADH-quinone oxidoreductase subunit A
MSGLVGYLVLFLLVGSGFVFIHLMIGKLIRPARPHPEKMTIYECGEPTIGSAWVQFDLRFYVVALLFVIFDVEVAFFFPWAVVFGQANALAKPEGATAGQVQLATREFLDAPQRQVSGDVGAAAAQVTAEERAAAGQYAFLAIWDIIVFFGVLLVGFAYLWARGDLKWVRSLAAEEPERAAAAEPAALATGEALVGAGR